MKRNHILELKIHIINRYLEGYCNLTKPSIDYLLVDVLYTL